MPDATNEIVIDRSPADVFAFLSDPTNDPRWRTGVLDIAHESGSGLIYVATVKAVGELTESLRGLGFAAAAYHYRQKTPYGR